MTDGRETTRLGRQADRRGECDGKNEGTQGKKKTTLHIYSACGGFALFLTFALACDNSAFTLKCMFLSSVTEKKEKKNQHEEMIGIIHSIIHQMEWR